MDISDNTASDLEDDIVAPIIIEECREQVTKRMKDDGYVKILGSYIMSIFQEFESFFRTKVDLVEDDKKLVLDEYNSSFVTYELKQGVYNFEDLFEALFNILQPEYPRPSNVTDVEFDDITMKTKLVEQPGVIAIRFDEKSFFSTILSFTSVSDYKHYNECISQKTINLGNTSKIHLKADFIDGSVVDGLRQPILYSFVLDKTPGYKVFSEPETKHYKKTNQSVLNTIAFYLGDDNNEEVNFNGESLTFTIRVIKI